MPQSKTNSKDLSISDLQTQDGIFKLDKLFLDYLQSQDKELHAHLLSYRADTTTNTDVSPYFLMDVARHMEHMLADFFTIKSELTELNSIASNEKLIAKFKKQFVKKATRNIKKFVEDDECSWSTLNNWLMSQLPINSNDIELDIASLGVLWLDDAENNQDNINKLITWCVAALATNDGKAAVANMTIFQSPLKLDYNDLVHEVPVQDDPYARHEAAENKHRQREGFELTDNGMNDREIYNEIHYCAYCHKNDGDFCSTGFPVKKKNPDLGFKVSPLGDLLTGCPLEERISEMQYLKREGYSLAALAMIVRDNPMCAVTGHRICNDCMKSCIYQKQEPVDIPQVETKVLTDVLHLPWGAEIYLTLIRWNPLRPDQYQPKPYGGRNVCVMGMGPAGFSLAHHLLMDGCAVVGFDGLKIEPLDRQRLMQPIKRFSDLAESLADRVMMGFGGVAEYGITVRWDKNFLKLILVSLMRRPYFQIFGNVRFGGTLTVNDVWDLGFDHLALAVGAGLPKELNIPNSLAPGMRQANDFLMSLQLTGASKKDSLANLQVRLPAVVIGGGLTGVDTATEVQAYYLVQIEKIKKRYDALVLELGEREVRAKFASDDLIILDEFLGHAIDLEQERLLAKQENRQCNTVALLRRFGGVTIVYRRSMQDSPAYKRNHEELTKALEEGIYYAQALEPDAVILDQQGKTSSLRCRWRILDEHGDWLTSDEHQSIPAHSIFVATGAQPNVAYEFEHRGTFNKQRYDYQRFDLLDGKLQASGKCNHIKDSGFGAFTSYQQDQYKISFLGDTHAVFHGSVVKAIASAKRVYPEIMKSLVDSNNHHNGDYQSLHNDIKHKMTAKVVSVVDITKDVIELTIHAPQAAKNFTPGQFYRIQNYETLAPTINNTKLHMEALALMALPVKGNNELLRFVIKENGVSSRLVKRFKPNDPVALMGPSGVKHILPNEPQTVLVVGGFYALLYILSAGPTYKKDGHKIIFISMAEDNHNPIYQDLIAEYCETIHLGSRSFVDCIAEYEAKHATTDLSLGAVSRVMVLDGSDILQQVQCYRKSTNNVFNSEAKWSASVYGPMQCMLKGVCAQCLQWQIDPITGERTKAVYACSWHQMPIDIIDTNHISQREDQNSMQETLTKLWLEFIL